MKRLLVIVISAVLASAPVAVLAQSSAQPVLPGLLKTSGCTAGVTVCYFPYSVTNPLPVTPSAPSGTQDENLKQVNGATVDVGVGTASTGTQRVTTSTDSTIGTVTAVTGITNALPAGSNVIGHVIDDAGSVTAISPAARTIVPLDISTVTTGGTAVTALSAGHRTAGGFLLNPIGATINLCINEQGAASGTTSAGALTCILPGQSYSLAPAAGAVSVITSDSSHPFSGYGLN